MPVVYWVLGYKEPSGTVPTQPSLLRGYLGCEVIRNNAGTTQDYTGDTFKDEAEETLRVAKSLKQRLGGIRLDTPSERGGVTPGLIKEIRARLDQEGFNWVKIFVSGGLDPERIRLLSEAGANAFGVGSYISSTSPIDMTMDIKEVEGKAIAKRGRIPGLIHNDKLRRVK